MATRKPHVTRTFAPIHFEDLDPHRFEDLVRELIYDFKEWQTIEATGRSGSDDGFDIRAYEKVARFAPLSDDEGEEEAAHPMEGNRWMIQGKREKAVSPADVKRILADLSEDDPPYGYILSASAVFSKKSYDSFREILRQKGVMEFHLWGNAELEDMLRQPTNDRILFTFFGISLVSRRRSRTTEVRGTVNVKNKLYKVLGDAVGEFNAPVLLRDINDTNYPFKETYADFDVKPRWAEREAFSHHPLGVWVHFREFFAFIDRDKKEWDFTDSADLLFSRIRQDEEAEARKRRAIGATKKITDYLPRSMNGTYYIDKLVRYEDIALVDAEGDGYYKCPHLFLDFSTPPYRGTYEHLSVGQESIQLSDWWRRIEYFKNAAPIEMRPPDTAGVRAIDLDAETLKAHFEYKKDAETLYAVDDRYDNFAQGNIVPLRVEYGGECHYLRITYIQKSTLSDYLRNHPQSWQARRFATRQIGREITDTEVLTIVEADRVYPSQWRDRD